MNRNEIEFLAQEMQLSNSQIPSLIIVHGTSMSPFLKDADELVLLPATSEDVKIGDIVICKWNNSFMARRFFRKSSDMVNLRPDNQSSEFNVSKDAILGIVIERRRQGGHITCKNWYWIVYAYLVVSKYMIERGIKKLSRMITIQRR